MANENFITDGTSYVTSTSGGGTLFFESLYPAGSQELNGQIWLSNEDESNTTITCVFPGENPLYLSADSASEGAYIGANPSQSDTSIWKIGADESIQLMSNGAETGLFADVSDDLGLYVLTKTPSQKWKFTKSTRNGSGR